MNLFVLGIKPGDLIAIHLCEPNIAIRTIDEDTWAGPCTILVRDEGHLVSELRGLNIKPRDFIGVEFTYPESIICTSDDASRAGLRSSGAELSYGVSTRI